MAITLPYSEIDGTVASGAQMQANLNVLLAAANLAFNKDGSTPPTNNIPMAGFNFTGLADAVGFTSAVTLNQLQLSTGSSLIGFIQAGTGAVARYTQSKLRDVVSVKDFGADSTGGVASSTAIQAALTGSAIVSAGTYLAHGLTMSVAGRALEGQSLASINRDATGSMLTISASDTVVARIQFNGMSATPYAGDLCTITGARTKLLFTAFRDAGTDYAVNTTSSRTLILSDHDSYYGKVLFKGPGGGANAMTYSNIALAQVTGRMEFVDTGFCTSVANLFGGLLIDQGIGSAGGQGAKVLATRIVGDITITQSGAYLGAGSAVSGNVTIGDGATTFTGITVDASFLNDQSIVKTFWIKDGVQSSTFFIDQLFGGSSTVTLSNTVRQQNNIYHRAIAFALVLTGGAGGGTFVPGTGGSAVAKFSQQGGNIAFTATAVVGTSGTTIPTGAGVVICALPVPIATQPAIGSWNLNKAGVQSFGYWTVASGATLATLYNNDGTILTWTTVNVAGAVLTITGGYGL